MQFPPIVEMTIAETEPGASCDTAPSSANQHADRESTRTRRRDGGLTIVNPYLLASCVQRCDVGRAECLQNFKLRRRSDVQCHLRHAMRQHVRAFARLGLRCWRNKD